MPVRNVFVRDASSNVKHDDAALTVYVVAISQSTEFLLPRGIPDVELNGSVVL